jgi:hypothetical protein
VTGPALLPRREQLEEVIPAVTGPMRRYLIQIGCVLRPGSVSGADLALRSFAAFLAEGPRRRRHPWPGSPTAISRTSSPGWPAARARTGRG